MIDIEALNFLFYNDFFLVAPCFIESLHSPYDCWQIDVYTWAFVYDYTLTLLSKYILLNYFNVTYTLLFLFLSEF